MNVLDYREKLGIGFNDKEKVQFFINRMYNKIELLCELDMDGMEMLEYFRFCDWTGTKYNTHVLDDYDTSGRFHHVINVLDRHRSYLEEFLLYYMAFVNSVSTEKENWNRDYYKDLIANTLTESHIPYDILEENSEYFIFPKGAPELDAALVSQPLDWLSDYPTAQTAWVKALKEYSNQTDDNASDIADKFRKALEAFFQEFFDGNKSLENYKADYGDYLKAKGVPAELSGNFQALLMSYTNYINGYAKHHDKTSQNVLEYILYQTGNIMRLLITLKQEES